EVVADPAVRQRQAVAEPAGVEIVIGQVGPTPVRQPDRGGDPAPRLLQVVRVPGQPVRQREVDRGRPEVGDARLRVLLRRRGPAVPVALLHQPPPLRRVLTGQPGPQPLPVRLVDDHHRSPILIRSCSGTLPGPAPSWSITSSSPARVTSRIRRRARSVWYTEQNVARSPVATRSSQVTGRPGSSAGP